MKHGKTGNAREICIDQPPFPLSHQEQTHEHFPTVTKIGTCLPTQNTIGFSCHKPETDLIGLEKGFAR
eukprot:5316596-Amphidinium_carterae.1